LQEPGRRECLSHSGRYTPDLFAFVARGKKKRGEALRRRDHIDRRIWSGVVTGCHISSPFRPNFLIY
jgi:hypothetical protein